MTEAIERRKLVAALKSRDAISVENTVHRGTPDVNFADGWIEIKWLDRWPKKAVPKFSHFSGHQRAWIKRRAARGGLVYVVVVVAGEWLVLDGMHAAEQLGKATVEQLRALSMFRYMSDREMKRNIAWDI